MLESALIESEAVRDLSGKWALLCLVRFHQKAYRKKDKKNRKNFNRMKITNNGEIIFTYAEAQELGMKSSSTFNNVLRELVEDKGFIDIAEKGDWYRREPTKYAISHRWKRYGTTMYERVVMPKSPPKGIPFKKKDASVERSQQTSVERSESPPIPISPASVERSDKNESIFQSNPYG